MGRRRNRKRNDKREKRPFFAAGSAKSYPKEPDDKPEHLICLHKREWLIMIEEDLMVQCASCSAVRNIAKPEDLNLPRSGIGMSHYAHWSDKVSKLLGVSPKTPVKDDDDNEILIEEPTPAEEPTAEELFHTMMLESEIAAECFDLKQDFMQNFGTKGKWEMTGAPLLAAARKWVTEHVRTRRVAYLPVQDMTYEDSAVVTIECRNRDIFLGLYLVFIPADPEDTPREMFIEDNQLATLASVISRAIETSKRYV